METAGVFMSVRMTMSCTPQHAPKQPAVGNRKYQWQIGAKRWGTLGQGLTGKRRPICSVRRLSPEGRSSELLPVRNDVDCEWQLYGHGIRPLLRSMSLHETILKKMSAS